MSVCDLQRWLQLSFSGRCSAARLKVLYQQAGSIAAAMEAALPNLQTLGWPEAGLAFWQNWQAGIVAADVVSRVERTLAWQEQPGHHIVVYGDKYYPPLLYSCVDPPPQLFVAGNPSVLSLPQMAIVGSRHPTVDGRKLARRFAGELAQRGYQVTSGLALGIDSESHQAVLALGAVTIAVLGCGIAKISPVSQQRLAAQISEKGAVISEFPPGARAEAWHFPERNRIISGLSHGVLVVEAAERSGSLITARLAAEQGREVFAIPGSINNPLVRGCHRLLRQGAKLVEKVEDILEELPAMLAWERGQAALEPISNVAIGALGKQLALPPLAERLLDELAYDPVSLDSLVLATGQAVEQLLPCLLQLELVGVIEARLGGYVRLST